MHIKENGMKGLACRKQLVSMAWGSNEKCWGGPVGQVPAKSGSWFIVTNITTNSLPSLCNGVFIGASYQIDLLMFYWKKSHE